MKYAIAIVLALFIASCQRTVPPSAIVPPSTQGMDSSKAIELTKIALPQINAKLAALHADSASFCNFDSLTAALESVPGVKVVSLDSLSLTLFAEIGENGPLLGVSAKPRPWMKDTAWGVSDTMDTVGLAKATAEVVPTGGNVRLLYGLGSSAYPNWTPAVQTIITKSKRKYTPTLTEATLSNLSAVKGDDIVLFYTHGYPNSHWINPKSLDQWHYPGFCLSTTDQYDEVKVVPAGFEKDYAERRIVLMYVVWDKIKSWGGLAVTDEKYFQYAITAGFVQKYWKINANGWVNLAACHSGQDCAAGMRSALASVGASCISGWTEEVDGDFARKSTCFLFDRLLGANSYSDYKITPKQRPFPKADVLTALGKNGLLSDPYKGATFTYFSGTGDPFGLLTPTIQRLNVDDVKAELKITGSFGSEQANAKVKIAGSERTIKSFSEHEIIADLKPADYGDVEVDVSDHPSNMVQLTQWPLTIKWTLIVSVSLVQEIKVTSYLRADVHEARSVVEGEVKAEAVDLMPSKNSLAYCTSSGSYTDATGNTVTYSGSVQTPSPYDGIFGTNFVCAWASFDPNAPAKLKWWLNANVSNATTATSSEGPTIQIASQFMPLPDFCYPDQFNSDYTNKAKFATYPIVKDLVMDANFTIAAGSIGPVVIGDDGLATLSWESTVAQSPPAKDAQK
jgi:hypothetical protein